MDEDGPDEEEEEEDERGRVLGVFEVDVSTYLSYYLPSVPELILSLPTPTCS
jgi:hypothetical protein